MNVIAFLLSVVLGPAPTSAAPLIQAAAADEHADIYVIYSILMTNPATSHGPSTDELYLISEMTRRGHPEEPCVRVPPQYQMAYQETLDEYHRRKDKPVKLERALNIAKPYVLLNPEQVAQFIDNNHVRPTPYPNPHARFRIATDLFWLGDVYFNKAHTLALTAFATYCGSACGIVQWRVFEKSTARWEERPWGCGGIALIEQRIIASAARIPLP